MSPKLYNSALRPYFEGRQGIEKGRLVAATLLPSYFNVEGPRQLLIFLYLREESVYYVTRIVHFGLSTKPSTYI